jgi:hypothetical protein
MKQVLGLRVLALGAALCLTSCQYSWRYVFANDAAGAVTLTYRIRADTSDICSQCQSGFWRLSKPVWIVQDSLRPKAHHRQAASPTEYSATREGQVVIFRLTVPPGSKVVIYEHSSSDEFRGIPFRLVSLEAVSEGQRLAATGDVLKTLFRRDRSYGYVLTIPGNAAA